ncbi:MAG: sulfatase-modifying factor protein [Flavobacteriales bacterium]|nr:sulfatase-modifying factor protein [Flavobacteriales bacterium]|tara:strand:+ start:247 stop:1197 length:951 start_codon:yes stop_codon:yes gene_type:complete
MPYLLKQIFYFNILFFLSCVNKNDKTYFSNTHKFYIIENLNENDIVTKIEDKYDTSSMVFVKGGRFIFGNNNGLDREKPEHEVVVQSFLMDKNLVSVEDFRVFINLSNYTTEAEKFGNAIVYNDSIDVWELVDGANWEYPLGKNNTIASDNHPVTQVSWNDALAYCEFCDKTLPSEVQWEYAASEMGKKKNQLYYWGNDLLHGDNHMCNIWTSGYPDTIGYQDGFKYTSPIGYFEANSLGIFDMAGNVWEWCYNWHLPYEGNLEVFPLDLQGRAQRGGSFLCNSNYCHGYRLSARSATSPESSLFHVGFRCVKNIK